MSAPFSDRLFEAMRAKSSRVCLGLDPRIDLVPAPVARGAREPEDVARAFREFCMRVIDASARDCAAVKPQAAFFEALGSPGVRAFEDVCAHARERGLLVIADVKRGDIGTTAEAYATAALAPRGSAPPLADACTVNPYLGFDGVEPFIRAAVRHHGGIFVLVKTSNPSSGDLQDQQLASGGTVAEHVASLVARWNAPRSASGYGPVGAVVGATWPEHVRSLRAKLEGSVILLPGYGAQGAGPKDVVAAFDAAGMGALVTASRSLTFPWGRADAIPAAWEDTVADAASRMRREIQEALERS